MDKEGQHQKSQQVQSEVWKNELQSPDVKKDTGKNNANLSRGQKQHKAFLTKGTSDASHQEIVTIGIGCAWSEIWRLYCAKVTIAFRQQSGVWRQRVLIRAGLTRRSCCRSRSNGS